MVFSYNLVHVGTGIFPAGTRELSPGSGKNRHIQGNSRKNTHTHTHRLAQKASGPGSPDAPGIQCRD